MNGYIKILKSYLEERPLNYDYEDADTLLELLYYHYTAANPVENAVIRFQYKSLDAILNRLPWEENDQVFGVTVELCSEYSRRAFLEGVRAGARLTLELLE